MSTLSTHSSTGSTHGIFWSFDSEIIDTVSSRSFEIKRSGLPPCWPLPRNSRDISDSETSTTDWMREEPSRSAGKIADKTDQFDAIRGVIRSVEALRSLKDGWADEDSVAPREAAIREALQFLAKLPKETLIPTVSAASDGEIVIEWKSGGKEAVVGIDGDGTFGYALLLNSRFSPGREDGLIYKDELPLDLLAYIRASDK